MLWAYRLLLRFYPRERRLDFADEMLAVFERASQDQRRSGWFPYTRFAVREFLGLLGGACVERARQAAFAAVLGGIALAALLHTAFYAATSKILRASAGLIERSTLPPADPLAPPLTLGLFAVASIFCLLPLFLLLSARLMRRQR